MNRYSIACATLFGLGCLLAGPSHAQEVKPDLWSPAREAKLSPVTQAKLDAADKNTTDFLLTNGNYAQTRFYPAKQINRDSGRRARPVRSPTTQPQREEPARRVDFPDPRQGIIGNFAYRGRWGCRDADSQRTW
jgi:hypothetical protein